MHPDLSNCSGAPTSLPDVVPVDVLHEGIHTSRGLGALIVFVVAVIKRSDKPVRF